MLLSYFDYSFVHLIQKVRLRPELSPKFWSILGPSPARTQTRPEKPGPTYNSAFEKPFRVFGKASVAIMRHKLVPY